MPFQLCVCFDATEAFVCVLTIASLSKVNSDGMPLPRVNEIINSLGSKSWFGALEISKAYHQGFIDKSCRHLTAFSAP